MNSPFLILPNHTNQWDPFILCFAIPRPIHWVAGEGAFRDSSLKSLMLLGGAIPKIKGQPDMQSIQDIKKAINMGDVAGIFPEGEQTWDGRMCDLVPATAKLIRYLKVPVIVPIIKGGYLSKPRWAWKIRRSRIEVEFTLAINAQEIKTMTLSQIEERLRLNLNHDEMEWQKTAMNPIAGEQRAEHLELAHYACPACQHIGTLKSSGNKMMCNCGYGIYIDRFGFFHYPEDGPKFDHPSHWIQWQNNMLVDRLKTQAEKSSEECSDPVLLQDADISLMKSEGVMPMAPILQGEARLYKDRIEIGDLDNNGLRFPIKEISSVTTFKQQKFEFRFQNAQYRFAMPSRRVSGYKWEVAVKGLQYN